MIKSFTYFNAVLFRNLCFRFLIFKQLVQDTYKMANDRQYLGIFIEKSSLQF